MNRAGFLVGLGFGLVLAATRLNDYDVIHRMLLLQEPDVFLLMGSAIAVAAPLLWWLKRSNWRTPLGGPLKVQRSPVQRSNVLGSMVFGTGWAVAGTCPGPALAMVAGGSLPGAVVVAGIFSGLVLRDRVARLQAHRAAAAETSPTPANV